MMKDEPWLEEEEVGYHDTSAISPRRIAAAIRQSAKDGGQGHSYDHEAVQSAIRQELLVFHWWPAGHWYITDKGVNFLVGTDENENSGDYEVVELASHALCGHRVA
jgi:hypothetical protein